MPLGVEHADELVGVLGDPALHTFIGGRPETLAELRARYARWAAGSPDPATQWLNWAIRFDAADRLVGTVQATVTGAEAEVAWVVGTGWQGRGFATEAAGGLAAWLLAQGVGTLVAHVHPANVASVRVARALGLRLTGTKQDDEDEWAYTVRS
ncbi:MAG TPA: GNAT family N-acetyltransferase [Pseudonocardiaceae bacterium]